MSRFYILFLLLHGFLHLAAQSQNTALDTTIYQIVDEMPRFPGCEQLDTTVAFKNQCAQRNLLQFVYGNLRYPLKAQRDGNEGTVVVSFVVEPDSVLSNVQIIRDIGGGTGAAVLELVSVMNEVGVRWSPGKKQGTTVRTRFTMPVKFKLEEAPPYTFVEGDTVYTQWDAPLTYLEGDTSLARFVAEQLTYPDIGNDSCSIGAIDAQVLVEADGDVRILDLSDYNDLGLDFQFSAINAITSTMGKWQPATYDGRLVPTTTDIRLTFVPTDTVACASQIARYEQANVLVAEGAQLYEQDQKEEGLARISEGIALFPGNAEFHYIRGQIYMNDNQMSEACTDLTEVKRILAVGWFDNILPLICTQGE